MSTEASQTPQALKLQSKIGWICQSLRWMLIAWLAWILAILVMSLFDVAATVEKINAVPEFKDNPVTSDAFLASHAVNFLSWACATTVGFAGWKLMSGYLSGDIFSETAATRMKRFGQAALFATLAGILLRPVSIWLLSSHYFQTLKLWNFLAPQDLLYLLISVFILSLARIFQAAAEINAENKEFV